MFEVQSDIFCSVTVVKSLNYDNSSLQDGFDTKYMSQVGVNYDGTVTWMPPALFQSSCEGRLKISFST